MASSSIASEALHGFADAGHYDRHRPSYPPAAVDALLDAARIKGLSGAVVVDLAAGSGKFTEALAQRGFAITAVEPHDGMRKELDAKKLPGVTTLDGLSTSIPMGDETADAIIAAQAFHWFANQESLKEIHRVLKADGVLGMIWNIDDYNQTKDANVSTAWEAKLRDLTWTFDDGKPRYRHNKWREAFDNQIRSTPLTITAFANPLFALPLGNDELKFTVWLTKDALWDRYSTMSQVAVLEGAERESVRRQFDEILDSDDVEKNQKGEIAAHGATVWSWASKVPS